MSSTFTATVTTMLPSMSPAPQRKGELMFPVPTIASSVVSGGLTALLLYKLGTPVWLAFLAGTLGGPIVAICMVSVCFMSIVMLAPTPNQNRE